MPIDLLRNVENQRHDLQRLIGWGREEEDGLSVIVQDFEKGVMVNAGGSIFVLHSSDQWASQ